MIDYRVVLAVFRKDMRQYLGNPTGYVFLTLFITVTAAAAFLQEGFFARNLADLAELNRVMPFILMLFVPAVTMSAWADERRWGTDELLLTAPVRDGEIVLGKYLGVLGMFSISLAFSLIHIQVLRWLGQPDIGLMVATYLGYWCMGALFCAIGLFASMLSPSTTVGFILGAISCGVIVFAGTVPWANSLISVMLIGALVALVGYVITGQTRGLGAVGLATGLISVVVGRLRILRGDGGVSPFDAAVEHLSVQAHFSSFSHGIVALGDVVYFSAGTVVMLYVATLLLGRRHW